MALKKNYEVVCVGTYNLPWGQELAEEKSFVMADAYIKVVSVEGTKDKMNAQVQITSENKNMAKIVSFSPNMEGDNFIRQAYKHLKTLPEFDGATDC
jgi:SepF-like predicted cell division protein (DUF552 family)